jgi:hypothetical protein
MHRERVSHNGRIYIRTERFTTVVEKPNRCMIQGCNDNIVRRQIMPEQVCSAHRVNALRALNLKNICDKQGCGEHAMSSGYCSTHTAEQYVQRTDLFPENQAKLTDTLRKVDRQVISKQCRYCNMYCERGGVCEPCHKKIQRLRIK